MRELSACLTEPGCSAHLRPAQAVALRELYCERGLFAPMRVGAGKTLVSLLAAPMLGARRPLLVVRGEDRDKTIADFARYRSAGWRVQLPRLATYSLLGHPRHADDLPEMRPDLIIMDEAHKVANLGGTAAWRLDRYIRDEGPAVAVMSGSMVGSNLMDYWHLLRWALRDRAPVPALVSEAERWAEAVDADVPLFRRRQPDALGLDRIPGGFHSWLLESCGVVPTSEECGVPLTIRLWSPPLPPALVKLAAEVADTGLRPDGELLGDWGRPDCVSQIAGAGFYYIWDPLPPDWWLLPRKRWYAYTREILAERIPAFDSCARIANAIEHDADVPALELGRQLLADWRAVKARFEPNNVPIWVDDTPLRQAANAPGGTILWTRHTAAGERLAELGIRWYPGGTNAETAPYGRTIACQISAQGTGKNLQHGWHRNRVLTPMAKDKLWEQLIGRTHRPGQTNPVDVEIAARVPYHHEVIKRVRDESARVSANNGYPQKLHQAAWAA